MTTMIEKVLDPDKQQAINVLDEFGDSGIDINASPAGGIGQPPAVVEPVKEPAAPAAAPAVALVVEPTIQAVDDPAAPVVEPTIQAVDDPAAPVVEPIIPPVEDPAAPAVEPIIPPVEDPAFTTIEDPAVITEEPIDNSRDYNALSERLGYEVENEEDIVTLVTQLKTADPYENDSPLVKKAREIESSGGDVKQFFRSLTAPIENLSDREVLYEKFLADHPNLVTNPEFARQKFEREHNAKYGILSDERLDVDFDDDADYRKFQSDKKFAKGEMEFDSKAARETLKGQQEELLLENPSASSSNAEATESHREAYLEESKSFMDDFETIQIPIDVEGKSFYNVSLNDDSKPVLKAWVDSPAEFLDYIGIPSDGSNIDAEKLNSHMAMTAIMSSGGEKGFGHVFYQKMTERINRKTIETELINPAPPNTVPGTPTPPAVDELNEAIDDFAALAAKPNNRRG